MAAPLEDRVCPKSKFGKWEVVSTFRKDTGYKRLYANVKCECGVEKAVDAASLVAGGSSSCLKCRRSGTLKHGYAKRGQVKAEWQAWNHMIQRCTNPHDKHYHDYGSRGITVCQRWADSFEAFLADMGPKPGRKLSLDRIENDKNYEPGNCRWATTKQQSQNRRGLQMITFRGETLCLNEWARRVGLKRTTLAARLLNLGWSVEKALTEKP